MHERGQQVEGLAIILVELEPAGDHWASRRTTASDSAHRSTAASAPGWTRHDLPGLVVEPLLVPDQHQVPLRHLPGPVRERVLPAPRRALDVGVRGRPGVARRPPRCAERGTGGPRAARAAAAAPPAARRATVLARSGHRDPRRPGRRGDRHACLAHRPGRDVPLRGFDPELLRLRGPRHDAADDRAPRAGLLARRDDLLARRLPPPAIGERLLDRPRPQGACVARSADPRGAGAHLLLLGLRQAPRDRPRVGRRQDAADLRHRPAAGAVLPPGPRRRSGVLPRPRGPGELPLQQRHTDVAAPHPRRQRPRDGDHRDLEPAVGADLPARDLRATPPALVPGRRPRVPHDRGAHLQAVQLLQLPALLPRVRRLDPGRELRTEPVERAQAEPSRISESSSTPT